MGSTGPDSDIVLLSSGSLLKWTNFINGWRERYFEIKHGQLMYYASKADQASGCRGSIALKKLEVTLHEFNECEFSVSVGDIVWYLRAENPHSRTFWIKALSKHSTDSDYSSNTTKTHSRNTSISSLKFADASEEQNTIISRIAELEAYRTMYREQMSSIRRELQQIGVPQAKILSIHATHVAMLDNINHIILLAKNERGSIASQGDWVPSTPVSPTASPMPAVDEHENASNENTVCQNTAPQSVNDVTSECGDEWHDADEHSSLSLDSAEEATERRNSPVQDVANGQAVVSVPQEIKTVEKPKRVLLFGDYDEVLIPKDHPYYSLVDQLAKEQLK
ncbi:hypothetical protein Q1695_010349 [Nippostrongylus brasiliensis]|nr:hypothetical protein Q1695_010349 [Nippostrongylus brasiliensis]